MKLTKIFNFGGFLNMPDMDNKLDFSKLYNLNNETDVQELESLSNDILGYDSLFKEDNEENKKLKNESENLSLRCQEMSTSEMTKNELTRHEGLISYPEEMSSKKMMDFQALNTENLENFLKTQVGTLATVEMLVGINQSVNKIGIITLVGDDYLLLKEAQTENILVCPLKNIEFIRLNY